MADGAVYVTFGGDTAALEASLASAKAAISSFTRELSSLAREQVKTGASAESDLGQKMLAVAGQVSAAKARYAELSGEIRNTGGAATTAGDGIAKLREGLKRVAEIAGIAWSVDAIKDWIAATTEASEKIESFAAKLGASPEQVQKLQAEAKLAGVDFDEMAQQLERMQLQLARVDAPTSAAAHALQALGIDVKEFRAATMIGQLEMLAAATSRYADGANKTAAMQALLGRSGADMIPYLDRLGAGVEDVTQRIDAANVVMAGPQVAAFAKTKEDLSELGLAWQGLSQRIYSVVNPAIDAAVKELTRLVSAMNVNDVRTGVESLTDTSIDLAASIEAFAARASSALGGLGKIMENLAKINNMTPQELNKNALEGLFDLIGGKEGGEDQDAAQTAAQKLTDQLAAISKGAEDAKAKMHALYATESPSPFGDLSGISFGGAGKPTVPQMDLGGGAQKGAEEARQAFAEQVQAAQDAEKGVATTLDNQLKLHQVTMRQWLADTNAALDAESLAIIAAANKATASAALTSAQKNAIWQKEAHELQQIADQEANAQAKAAEQSAQAWKSGADTMASLIDSQVDGVLKGTTSVAQAYKNMLASAIEDVLKFCIKWTAEHAATIAANVFGLGAQTTATVAATATQTGAVAAGAAAQKAINASTISADAGRAAAGAYAAVAGVPIIGPILAPAAAAVAFAGVEAFGAFEQGAWTVPDDMVALIHAGEKIVPSGPPARFLDAMASGGPGAAAGAGGRMTVAPQFHIHSMDSATVASTLMNNRSNITKAMAAAVRDGAHLAQRRGVRFV